MTSFVLNSGSLSLKYFVGILSKYPPSIYCLPLISTGSKTRGIETEARHAKAISTLGV
ncbi:hypothetical protein A1E_02805 [Rickettsia canadensis str. McKiel]|uniref:Uncharacterized protein n=1 Tax=Rickettsia canadensis (strain McKiel) TaxID=293613 RepID=A8EYR9_RICCK|nr:hypothetical protein A1E_02805 [Rickettsia canadensis str. McKiel]